MRPAAAPPGPGSAFCRSVIDNSFCQQKLPEKLRPRHSFALCPAPNSTTRHRTLGDSSSRHCATGGRRWRCVHRRVGVDPDRDRCGGRRHDLLRRPEKWLSAPPLICGFRPSGGIRADPARASPTRLCRRTVTADQLGDRAVQTRATAAAGDQAAANEVAGARRRIQAVLSDLYALEAGAESGSERTAMKETADSINDLARTVYDGIGIHRRRETRKGAPTPAAGPR